MNILHLFVAQGNHHDTKLIWEQLRMLRHVYGLRVLTPTQDGCTVTALAAESRKSFSDHMREAVAMVVEEEEELLEQRRRALPAALGLVNHHLPSLAIEKIGRLSGLLLGRAESINEKIDNARESKGRRKQ